MLSVIRRARKSLGQMLVGLGAVVLSACVPATGPGTPPPGGGSVQVVQNFYGPVDKSQVFTASRDGVKSALRARGMR